MSARSKATQGAAPSLTKRESERPSRRAQSPRVEPGFGPAADPASHANPSPRPSATRSSSYSSYTPAPPWTGLQRSPLARRHALALAALLAIGAAALGVAISQLYQDKSADARRQYENSVARPSAPPADGTPSGPSGTVPLFDPAALASNTARLSAAVGQPTTPAATPGDAQWNATPPTPAAPGVTAPSQTQTAATPSPAATGVTQTAAAPSPAPAQGAAVPTQATVAPAPGPAAPTQAAMAPPPAGAAPTPPAMPAAPAGTAPVGIAQGSAGIFAAPTGIPPAPAVSTARTRSAATPAQSPRLASRYDNARVSAWSARSEAGVRAMPHGVTPRPPNSPEYTDLSQARTTPPGVSLDEARAATAALTRDAITPMSPTNATLDAVQPRVEYVPPSRTAPPALNTGVPRPPVGASPRIDDPSGPRVPPSAAEATAALTAQAVATPPQKSTHMLAPTVLPTVPRPPAARPAPQTAPANDDSAMPADDE
jgi:hypothetical protein